MTSSRRSGPVPSLAIVDTSALVAGLVQRDPAFVAVSPVLRDRSLTFVVPAPCIGEACYLIAKKYGAQVEARFLDMLPGFDVLAPLPDDWPRIAELVRQYADFPLGGV